jgi:hypothetical protein
MYAQDGPQTLLAITPAFAVRGHFAYADPANFSQFAIPHTASRSVWLIAVVEGAMVLSSHILRIGIEFLGNPNDCQTTNQSSSVVISRPLARPSPSMFDGDFCAAARSYPD